jgi:hypothetical protein
MVRVDHSQDDTYGNGAGGGDRKSPRKNGVEMARAMEVRNFARTNLRTDKRTKTRALAQVRARARLVADSGLISIPS